MIVAIKGDKEKGFDIIVTLEMLGGWNSNGLEGSDPDLYYYLDFNKIISSRASGDITDDFIMCTIDEFRESYPHVVGDEVIFQNNTKAPYIVDSMWFTGDGGVECAIINKYIRARANALELRIINTKKDTRKYPTTYKECCEIMGVSEKSVITTTGKTEYDSKLCGDLDNFRKLLICRDAYWKIFDNWKPDVTDRGEVKYTLTNVSGKISFEFYGEYNGVLSFPTDEMRGEFFKNFKSEIEQCIEFI